MKLTPLFTVLLALFATNLVAMPQTVQRKYLRYIEHRHDGSQAFQNQAMPSKEQRTSSNSGDIILIYDETLPDSVKIALTAAKEL